MATMRERQKQVQLYRRQIPSPGAPTVAWREDCVRFWAAIAQGVKTEDAAAAAGVSSPVGFRWFRHAGGVNPCLPPTVSGRYLSFYEREYIALLKAQGLGVREIARRVGRHPSTISRELRRNASTRTWRLDYEPSLAQWHAERRPGRPKVAKLVTNDRLRDYVQDRLAGVVRAPGGREVGPDVVARKGRGKPHRKDRRWAQAWSPEQIASRLMVDFPDDESMRISHEAIYQALYVESRGALKRELAAKRPKPAKLATNPRLHEYVRERLSGELKRPDGTGVPGPPTTWKGLNKPHRADRRWASAWSPEQISRRLVVDFPDDEDMRISHEAT